MLYSIINVEYKTENTIMYDLIKNLVLGIAGGIYSSLIVSRVFFIKSELDKQIEIIRMTRYRLGGLILFFDVMYEAIVLSYNTSAGIHKETNPKDIVNTNDAINSMISLINKTVDEILALETVELKEQEYIDLRNETLIVIRKFINIKHENYNKISEYKNELEELEQKHDSCYKNQSKVLMRLLLDDWLLKLLVIAFIILCVMQLVLFFLSGVNSISAEGFLMACW